VRPESQRIQRTLGDGDVPRVVYEGGKLPVGDLVTVDPEPVHRDVVTGRLLGVVGVGAHPERRGRDPGHVVRPAARSECRGRGHGALLSGNTWCQSLRMLTTVQPNREAASRIGSATGLVAAVPA
jgi:hypothetical protein